MHEAVDALTPVEIEDEKTGMPRIRLWFENISVAKPMKEGIKQTYTRDHRLYPNQCREGATSYR